jgi:hypothetical protein
MGGKIGRFGQNWAKSGQTLEKDSQPRGLRFDSNKYSESRINLHQSLGTRF